MKKEYLCHSNPLLSYTIFACQHVFLFGCFLKERKLCSVLFAICLTLLLQTDRKWGVDQGSLCEFSEIGEPAADGDAGLLFAV